ncbi:MAG: folate-binding protein YgfZ [Gemmatimonadales bacterium]|nr:folate-binding protein YgfZ [Gemmatimonadales bacterium]
MMDRVPRSLTQLARLRNDPLRIPDRLAIFRIAGPGAEQCLQGLLTNDVSKPGVDTMLYGALLTPKGMIVVDYWVIRLADGFLFATDLSAQQASLDLFRRQLPPRLAKVTDLTESWAARWLLGERTDPWVSLADSPHPEPGRAHRLPVGSGEIVVGAPPSSRAGFRYLVLGPSAVLPDADAILGGTGALGEMGDLRTARVLAGFPTLGVEIDDRTLPQEVDFDGIGGISYTKGCYVGQETVARLHFRGHANWLLRGLEVTGDRSGLTDPIERDGKPVARIGTLIELGPDHAIGLAKVRREVEPGTTLDLAGVTVRVAGLEPGPWFIPPQSLA